jgi:hypothetical protein
VTILAGPLKRSIMSRIATLDLADPAVPGDDVEVVPALAGEPDRKCVFGGRTSWVQRETTAERNTTFEQTISFEVRVRVYEPGGDVDDVEREAERIVSLVTAGVCADPDLTGGRGRIVPTSGDSDPVVALPDPDPAVIVNLSVVFTVTIASVGA